MSKSNWADGKVSFNYMIKVIFPNLEKIEDPLGTIYNNALPSGINTLFSVLYGRDYIPVNTIEERHIEVLREVWKSLEEHGFVKDYEV